MERRGSGLGTPTVANGIAATGTLALAPPAGTEGTYYASFDATDSNADISLSDSKVIAIHVLSPDAEKTETPVVAPITAALPIMAPLAPAAAPVSPECFSGREFTIHWAISKDPHNGPVWLRIGETHARSSAVTHGRPGSTSVASRPAL